MVALPLVAALLAAAPPGDTAPVPSDEPASTAIGLAERDTRMTVDVSIDGAGPFRFLVDTGATRTVVSRQLAAMLRLPSAGRAPLHSVAGESEVELVRIARLSLGGLPARVVKAPALDAADIGAAGILGIDALAGKRVVIDLRRRTLSVEAASRRPRPAADAIVVTARRRYGQLVLADADAAGARVYAVVDTGSMTTIGNRALRDRLVRHNTAVRVERIADVAGRVLIADSSPIAALRIGPWRFAGLRVAFADAHAFRRFGLADKPAMLLGMDLLRVFERVSIDFRSRNVLFTLPKRG